MKTIRSTIFAMLLSVISSIPVHAAAILLDETNFKKPLPAGLNIFSGTLQICEFFLLGPPDHCDSTSDAVEFNEPGSSVGFAIMHSDNNDANDQARDPADDGVFPTDLAPGHNIFIAHELGGLITYTPRPNDPGGVVGGAFGDIVYTISSDPASTNDTNAPEPSSLAALGVVLLWLFYRVRFK